MITNRKNVFLSWRFLHPNLTRPIIVDFVKLNRVHHPVSMEYMYGILQTCAYFRQALVSLYNFISLK